MKKLLFLFGFMTAINISSYASTNFELNSKKDNNKLENLQSVSLINLENIPESCTVNISGSIGFGTTNISISCAATSANCDDASRQAIACLKKTIKLVKALF